MGMIIWSLSTGAVVIARAIIGNRLKVAMDKPPMMVGLMTST